MTGWAADGLRVLSWTPGQFYEVTTCPPGGPTGRAALRGDGRFAAYNIAKPDEKIVLDTFDEAIEAARSLIRDPQ